MSDLLLVDKVELVDSVGALVVAHGGQQAPVSPSGVGGKFAFAMVHEADVVDYNRIGDVDCLKLCKR